MMDKAKVLIKGSHPAHVHITTLNPKIILYKLNITGPCPKNGNDINQHYEKIPKNNKDKPMNGKIKTAIAEWAQLISIDENAKENQINCDFMQDLWLRNNKNTNPGNQKQK
jgi:hypothetical protein